MFWIGLFVGGLIGFVMLGLCRSASITEAHQAVSEERKRIFEWFNDNSVFVTTSESGHPSTYYFDIDFAVEEYMKGAYKNDKISEKHDGGY